MSRGGARTGTGYCTGYCTTCTGSKTRRRRGHPTSSFSPRRCLRRSSYTCSWCTTLPCLFSAIPGCLSLVSGATVAEARVVWYETRSRSWQVGKCHGMTRWTSCGVRHALLRCSMTAAAARHVISLAGYRVCISTFGVPIPRDARVLHSSD